MFQQFGDHRKKCFSFSFSEIIQTLVFKDKQSKTLSISTKSITYWIKGKF